MSEEIDYQDLKAELVEISTIVGKFPEEVQPKVYDLLIERYLGKQVSLESVPPAPPEQDKTEPRRPRKRTPKSPREAKPRRQSGKETYSIDRNLNLRGDGSIPSFKEFYEEKSPKNAKEVNAVAVYYLKKLLGLNEVTLDHAYTCYTEVKKKPPQAFKQSFIDTKNRTGWLEFDAEGNLDIPHRGVVFVEHDLPAAD